MSVELLSPAPLADQITAGRANLRQWLCEAAWPLWLTHGIDHPRGGFFEALDLQTRLCVAPYRRLRVVARQITVFSEAHRAGLPGAADAVRLGLAVLRRHASLAEGGYAWRFDLAHQPIDRTRDLYDHAFVLLALASASLVEGKAATAPEAHRLLAFIDQAFPHVHGGYLESLPPALPRRQNPHMHLLEALLAAYEAFGDDVFLTRAEGLIALLAERLFDHAAGALPEYFDDVFVPQRQNGSFLVEPGHHCEWVWLLSRAATLGLHHPQAAPIAARMMRFVDEFAIDPIHGGIVDALDSHGAVLEGGARLWPQTERLKAEFLRPDATPARQLQALQALAAYLRPDGSWHERRLADGTLTDQPAPASSLYHLTYGILAVC